MIRIQLHDFAGHPFQAQLSRELARRGYLVEHAYSEQYGSGKGQLSSLESDPPTLKFRGIRAVAEFAKYSPIGRVRFELSYARAWIAELARSQPDFVIACNVPLFVLQRFAKYAQRAELPWMLWHQDIFSLALAEELRKKVPGPIARLGSQYVTAIERKLVNSANRVVAIGDEFSRVYKSWGVSVDHVSVIPNWAPIDEITPQPRMNPWSSTHLPASESIRMVYAGTLGKKHNPGLLVELVRQAHSQGIKTDLVVISEGEGADLIRASADSEPSLGIQVLGFQESTELPYVLGSGDVLVAILEPEASRFSIPSKVLSYFAAGRPVIGLMPTDNPAAIDIVEAGGIVAEPNLAGVATAIAWLIRGAEDRVFFEKAGLRARQIAVDRFGIDAIADQFVALIVDGSKRKQRSRMTRHTHHLFS